MGYNVQIPGGPDLPGVVTKPGGAFVPVPTPSGSVQQAAAEAAGEVAKYQRLMDEEKDPNVKTIYEAQLEAAKVMLSTLQRYMKPASPSGGIIKSIKRIQ